MPVWNRSSWAETYQAGKPAIAGAPTTVEPSPAAPWQGTHASNNSAPEIGAATELRAQPVIVSRHVRLPAVAMIRTNGMPIGCRVVARELSMGRYWWRATIATWRSTSRIVPFAQPSQWRSGLTRLARSNSASCRGLATPNSAVPSRSRGPFDKTGFATRQRNRLVQAERADVAAWSQSHLEALTS